MAKTAQKSERKFKMADFLLCLRIRSKRLFCRYWAITCMYLFGVQNSVKRHFLLPAGGAMTMSEYEHGHVFRRKLLSNV